MSYINDIEKLIGPYIANGDVYASHSVKCLTAPGDNYGSLMLAVEVKTKKINCKDDQENGVLHLVAKKFPPNPAMQDIFQSPITFRKELGMYMTIIPTLIDFQREQGMENSMEFFPKFYNGLLEETTNGLAQNGDTHDITKPNETVILLENLKVSGFDTCDRMKGFDLLKIETILEDLAVFHAVPVGLKLKDPKRFQEKLLPYLDKFYCYDYMDESLKSGDLELMVEILTDSGRFNEDIIKRVRTTYTLGSNSGAISVSEPFGTLTHNDLWVNNVMIKCEDAKSVKNKLIDFQGIDYGSPGKDILFLIFSSVEQSVIEQHYDRLIEVYYDKFIKILHQLNCDTKEFSVEGLHKELKESAKNSQFFHLLIMAQIVFSDEHNAKALANNEEPIPTSEQKQRTCFIVEEFVKRNYI